MILIVRGLAYAALIKLLDVLLVSCAALKGLRLLQSNIPTTFRVVIKRRKHLFPFRTQQLSYVLAEVVAPQGAARKACRPVNL